MLTFKLRYLFNIKGKKFEYLKTRMISEETDTRTINSIGKNSSSSKRIPLFPLKSLSIIEKISKYLYLLTRKPKKSAKKRSNKILTGLIPIIVVTVLSKGIKNIKVYKP
jgi:hypothetical protein